MASGLMGRDQQIAVLRLVPRELRRVFSKPFDVLICLAGNALLATVLWFLAPTPIANLFFSFRNAFLFPVVLATWMLADVPATNQLGADPQAALERLDDPEAITLLIRSKQAVLWMLTTPVALVVAIITSLEGGNWASMASTVVWVATVPLAGLGLSCLVGVRWPYLQLPLKQRWAERSDLRRSLRWVALILLPYGLVPAVGLLALTPTITIYAILHGTRSISSLPHADDLPLFLGSIVAVPLAVCLWRWGTIRAGTVAVRRGERLRQQLSPTSRL